MVTMLMAENMLNELSGKIESKGMSDNDDTDFGTVLSFCSTQKEEHKLRFSNGEERDLSFDN